MSSLWIYMVVADVIWLLIWRVSADKWQSPRARGLASFAIAVGLTILGAIFLNRISIPVERPSLRYLPLALVVQLALGALLYIRGVKKPFSRPPAKNPDVIAEKRSPIEHTADDGNFLCDVIDARFGSTRPLRQGSYKQRSVLNLPHRAKLRVVHSWGSGASGTFTPDPAASELTTAAVFGAETEPTVRVRFSNFSSPAKRDDEAIGPRGMAIRLEAQDVMLDIVTISMDRFFARTREDFVSFSRAMARPSYVKFPWLLYLLVTGRTRIGVIRQLVYSKAPGSYFDLTYHGVNTFWFCSQEGVRTPIRYCIEPTRTQGTNDPSPGRLHREFEARLSDGAAYFDVLAVVGEGLNERQINDAMVPWPKSCRARRLGTLKIENPDPSVERLAFNPHNLCAGVEPSDDEILMARRAAYPVSVARRLGT